MPAVKKIKRDDIINAGIKIVKNEGMQNINARRIAKELNCSTQPLFYLYTNMDEIKSDIMNKITEDFYESLFIRNYDRAVYKDFGINYVKYAKNEPILYNLLFNNGYKEIELGLFNLTGKAEVIIDTIVNQTGLKKEDAKKFHAKMWLFVSGIANLIANNIKNFSDEEVDKLLGEHYMGVLLLEIQKGNIKKEVLDDLLKYKLNMRHNV